MTVTDPTAITFTTEGHRPVLIEDWLPIRELGIESVRERAAANDLPPLSFLHIWWARAPLAAAGGITLAALLPVWSDELLALDGVREGLDRIQDIRADLRTSHRPNDHAQWYRAWTLHMAGISSDVVAAVARREAALASGERATANPFKSPKAHKVRPSVADLTLLHTLLQHRWGRLPSVLDPTAGGGALPFTAMRYGLPTVANDLNPVAAGVLDATLHAPSSHGPQLVELLADWGRRLTERCAERLSEVYSRVNGGGVANYLFAQTVACPRTGGPIPMSPNWWLDKKSNKVAVRLEAVRAADGTPSHIDFHIEHGPKSDLDPDEGTVARGDAVSPWDGLVVDGEHIKAEAQAGRMWPTLYCTRIERPAGRKVSYEFRVPSEEDHAALERASLQLDKERAAWVEEDVLPDESLPQGNKTSEPLRYGMSRWPEMFTDRQLLLHGTFVSEWRKLRSEARAELGKELGDELMTLLAMLQNKAVNWNSKLSSWNVNFQRTRSTFDRHDFAFKWTFSEMDGPQTLSDFSLPQVQKAFRGIVELLQPAEQPNRIGNESIPAPPHRVPGPVTIMSTSAARLALEPESVELINIDPPYYDNVMYAELADFFYVWEKRTLGVINPSRFADQLTNKDDEAVANPARFADTGRRRQGLATFDYQQKMQAIFTECHRVLKDDGVMVVWFTHKRAEAWDTLGTAMMDAGFSIEASWPVTTQPEHSLHHAAKNSAKSTVILVCRKRMHEDPDGVFFDDIEVEVRQAAQDAVAKFEADVGVGGVDLMLATYGPSLSVISRNWPVLSSEAGEDGRSRRLKPEEALTVARQEVARLRMARLVGQEARFDPATDFWLMAWQTFRAREFPYDEARKLALGVGYDADEAVAVGLLAKKSGTVTLTEPAKRARRLRREAGDDDRLETLVDAVQHLLNVYRVDGLAAARAWLADSGYGDEHVFTLAVQAAVRAVPRVRGKHGFSLEEAQALEDAVVALFGDEVELPGETAESTAVEQQLDFTT